jgi:periplasmic protein TonB
MPNKPQDAGNPLASRDRRQHPRHQISPFAYVDLGEGNGGIALDISEEGFALTTVVPLPDDYLPRMRIQLPRSKDWIEASGEIRWKSKSKKEAGVRFVDLSQESRTRIREWISSESPQDTPQREKRLVPGEKRESPGEPAADSSWDSIPIFAKSGAAQESRRYDSIPIPISPPPGETQDFIPESISPQGPVVAEQQKHTKGAPAGEERRGHARRRVDSLAYIDLGEGNGGLLLDVGEGGLHVQAVVDVVGNNFSQVRFQLPGSKEWIEAAGEIAWRDESGRNVGIKFVDLPADARARIREWVSSEALRRDEAAPIDAARRKTERVVEMPNTREPRRVIPKPAASDKVFQGIPQIPISLSKLVSAPQIHDEPKTVPMTTLPLSAPAAATSTKSTPEPTDKRVAAGTWRRRLEMLPAYVSLIAILSFAAGMAAGPHGWSRVVGFLGRLTHSRTAPAHAPEPSFSGNVAMAPPDETSNMNNASPQVPAGSAQGSFEANARSQADSVKIPKPPENKDVASTFTPGSPKSARILKPNAASTPPREPSGSETLVTSSPSQVQAQIAVDNTLAKPSQGGITPATDFASPPQAPAPTREVISAPAPVSPPPTSSAPVNLERVVGSVTIRSDPYPSIRVPPDLKAQMSTLGTSLQMGGLIQRVDPTYPEEAERQHIEGTVKLHAIVGTDGAIRSIDVLSGPPLLAQAAARAVQQWRYKQTSLGGRAIETEEDVVAVFRLQIQKGGRN